ncbi:glycoside hydrolase [Parabacteroides sp. PF5-9]|uniref:glycoside hydrolase n=1 Tax=Parabacteroides sp. PF5-9 TaxID=1742404 RepID=UPI0024742851|nr:glycoside hydrolase [Parabacteroides sp. PF5-9]MDH6357543.1 hypothetical protein [Parabacteroides sp. PF5-9]
MQLYKYLLLHTLLLVLFACNKPAENGFKERMFLDLSGVWLCDSGEIRLPGTVDESRLVSLNSDTLQTGQLTRLYPFTGKMKYSKEIDIPASLAHKEWRLIMERTKPTTLWIDGNRIGTNALILSPQVYLIGKLSEGKHQLCIEVDNGENAVPQGIKGSHAWTDATQTNWNGIIGRFGLEAFEQILIESVTVSPQISSKSVRVAMQIRSVSPMKASIDVRGHSWNTTEKIQIPDQKIDLDLPEGLSEYAFEVQMGDNLFLWSEFDPALYKLNFELSSGEYCDYRTLDVGMRDFSTNGTQFTINSLKTFLRGKHDACVFPLTGYPPMEKEEWVRQFRISKQYGINHYRFHSWTPPQAAFDAANEEGIYMQAELPYWGTMKRDNEELNTFLIREGEHILSSYANNPSFVMMALGNELGGDFSLMHEIVDHFRNLDDRPFYAFGANNALGTAGQQEGEDFFVTCRVGGQVGSDDYSQHTRATFSFADAKDGGYMNGCYPSTDLTFETAIDDCTVPVISHENGQFQVYPNYDEIAKYTGVLYPYNLEIFRKRLEENGLDDQAELFHQATARFAALCYKADFEMCFRTPGFGGFQVLDLQDYPGQGSAYVGLLDAFMDSKEGMTPEEFKGFCNEIVPLAVMPKYCWSTHEIFHSEIKVSNYSAAAIRDAELEWTILNEKSLEILGEGKFYLNISQGELSDVGQIELPLQTVDVPTQLRLVLTIGSQVNAYDLWVYPEIEKINNYAIIETSAMPVVIETLKRGEKVLYTPDHKAMQSLSVGGLFTPDYWNYAMFKNISEGLGREVSPGTLSILTDPAHPLFDHFPTDLHSNWQWWMISKHSRPFILDKAPAGYKPLIQVIDNIERNHKLGLLFEFKVGEGSLLVSMCRLDEIMDKPEGRQFRQAIYEYMASEKFNPQSSISTDELQYLFNSTVAERDIIGVKNITTYE